ncbi:putative baseplate assembly protein [Streptomyces sp. NPDC002033]|uniref:putative baseplate assembly protein n=1 Tax=unclassified Streptomyces TaxID=2593676 RepID=UPI00332A155A
MSPADQTGTPHPAEALVTGVDRDTRRALVKSRAKAANGIDSVEVLANAPGTPGYVATAERRRTLLVRLLHAPGANGLRAANVRVLGGVRTDPRINPVRVDWAYLATAVAGSGPLPPGVLAEDRLLVMKAMAGGSADRTLVVRTSSPGDWSTYVLALTADSGRGVPPGFDEPLSRAPFSFTVDCPSELDCATTTECPPVLSPSPVLDYLARDYDALRTRLLDRLGALVPGWTDRSPADPVVTLVELFAALGDRLAAWQDGVAAEAYLGTARRRTSVRRHARLLDYRMREGVSARAWLAFTAARTCPVPAGTAVTETRGEGREPGSVAEALENGALVFETCAPKVITRERNRIDLHSWGDARYCLPAGSTSAFLSHGPSASPGLHAGDALVLGPKGSGLAANPARRQVVLLDREPVPHEDPLYPGTTVLEIHWAAEDALRVPLPVTAGARETSGLPVIVAEARANVILADHGGTLVGQSLGDFVPGSRGRPRVPHTGLAWAEPAPAMPRSASAALRPDPHRSRARIEVHDGLRVWRPEADLLSGDRLAATFAVESEDDGTARLRFGDGTSSRRPAPGSTLRATYRVGSGSVGNVGPDTLVRLLPDPAAARLPADISEVTNPLAAAGGADPETLDEVRELAPYAFRSQLRAVTSSDYADVAMRHPGVQRAVARRRWTGSWYAQEVAADPLAARADDPSVPEEVTALLETHRMAGVDVEVARPVYVPLEIVLDVCTLPGHRRADVVAGLLRVFSAGRLPDGSRGFFHPDNFTFGTPLFLSDVVATAMAVPGVAWVDAGDDGPVDGLRFRRLGAPSLGEARRGRIDAAAREVLRADSDPSNPENGRLVCRVRGER